PTAAPAAAKKAKTPAPAPTAAAPASTPQAPAATPSQSASAPQAAPSSSASGAASGSVTQQQAADAVRAYGARTSVEEARALLGKFGFTRTAEITPEKAAEVLAAATAEPEL